MFIDVYLNSLKKFVNMLNTIHNIFFPHCIEGLGNDCPKIVLDEPCDFLGTILSELVLHFAEDEFYGIPVGHV